jgi:hypothetical protein
MQKFEVNKISFVREAIEDAVVWAVIQQSNINDSFDMFISL